MIINVKSRVTLKYRNKQPSHGKVYVTDDNKSFMYKFTEKNDIEKLDQYLKSLTHMLANKPIVSNTTEMVVDSKMGDKKKNKKGKKH